MSGKKLRIACFHGYRQNEVLFREKTGSMRKLFKSVAEFEFLSAPLIPNVPEDDTRENSRGWWFSKPTQQFSSRDVSVIADGFDQSVETALDFLKTSGPFDGLLGFSQGASMVHLLLAMEQLDKAKLGIKFAIFFSGFLSLSSLHNDLTSLSFNLPTLHIYGLNDQIVLPETSKRLASQFSDHKSIEHDGGHFIPALTKSKQEILEFLNHFC